MSRQTEPVPRPRKKTEYAVQFMNARASKGWTDALSKHRNAIVDAWDFLTSSPLTTDGRRVYRLRDRLATVDYQGAAYDRYQYKFSDAGRIWYFVLGATDKRSAGQVIIEEVSVAHPKSTE